MPGTGWGCLHCHGQGFSPPAACPRHPTLLRSCQTRLQRAVPWSIFTMTQAMAPGVASLVKDGPGFSAESCPAATPAPTPTAHGGLQGPKQQHLKARETGGCPQPRAPAPSPSPSPPAPRSSRRPQQGAHLLTWHLPSPPAGPLEPLQRLSDQGLPSVNFHDQTLTSTRKETTNSASKPPSMQVKSEIMSIPGNVFLVHQ